jgi:predicted RNA-binding protein YlxR (DUF448 family)
VKAALARVVRRPDGHVVSDPSGRAAGRGAYVHLREDCLSMAEKRGSLERALETQLGLAGVASLMGELRASIGETR